MAAGERDDAEGEPCVPLSAAESGRCAPDGDADGAVRGVVAEPVQHFGPPGRPLDLLGDYVDAVLSLDEQVTAQLVAEEFEVPVGVAVRALELLADEAA